MVEITLTPDGPGTVLRLRHTGLPSDEEMRSHNAGWKRYIGALAATSSETPRPLAGRSHTNRLAQPVERSQRHRQENQDQVVHRQT